jgi:hypothetical protein
MLPAFASQRRPTRCDRTTRGFLRAVLQLRPAEGRSLYGCHVYAACDVRSRLPFAGDRVACRGPRSGCGFTEPVPADKQSHGEESDQADEADGPPPLEYEVSARFVAQDQETADGHGKEHAEVGLYPILAGLGVGGRWFGRWRWPASGCREFTRLWEVSGTFRGAGHFQTPCIRGGPDPSTPSLGLHPRDAGHWPLSPGGTLCLHELCHTACTEHLKIASASAPTRVARVGSGHAVRYHDASHTRNGSHDAATPRSHCRRQETPVHGR